MQQIEVLPVEQIDVNSLYELEQAAYNNFALADAHFGVGIRCLLAIYESKQWRREHTSWDAYLADFVAECKRRSIKIVSKETIEQEVRWLLRGNHVDVDVDTVLSIPVKVRNAVGRLAQFTRQGSDGYNGETENKFASWVSPLVRKQVERRYDLPRDTSDEDALRCVMEELATVESEQDGFAIIGELLAGSDVREEFRFGLTLHRNGAVDVFGYYTKYDGVEPVEAWQGLLSDKGVPVVVAEEAARRLGTTVRFASGTSP